MLEIILWAVVGIGASFWLVALFFFDMVSLFFDMV